MDLATTVTTFVALSVAYNLLKRYYLWRTNKSYAIPTSKYRRGEIEVEDVLVETVKGEISSEAVKNTEKAK